MDKGKVFFNITFIIVKYTLIATAVIIGGTFYFLYNVLKGIVAHV